MAGKPAIRVRGAVELRRALKRMNGSLGDMTPLHRRMANVVADEARRRVPMVSGRLRGSIKARGSKTRASASAGSRSMVPYAGPIHFGWRSRNIEPNPFLYGALDSRRRTLIDMYRNEVGDLVKRLDRETPG